MRPMCLRAPLCQAALALLLAASGSSGEQRLASRAAGHSADFAKEKAQGAVKDNSTQNLAVSAAPSRYTFRICNAYAFSQKLEVFQVRTATLLFDLPYKHCKDARLIIEQGEQIDFRLEDLSRDLFMQGDIKDTLTKDEEVFEQVFNHSDIAKDGVITFKEFDRWHRIMRPLTNPEEFIKDPLLRNRSSSSKLFNQMDENEDGKITVREFVDYQTFGSVASVGEDLMASFIISGELPDPGSMSTLLLLVLYKTPGKKPGTFLSGSFLDHAFGPKELDRLGTKNAILCIMDTFHGKNDPGHKVHVAYDNVSDGTNFSAGEHEIMPYDTVVGIQEGYYQLDLGMSGESGHHEIDEHVFYARPQVNYVVLRVGDTSDDAEELMDYSEELIVFPNPVENEFEDPATVEEIAVYDGISAGLIIAAVVVACVCVGGGAAAMQVSKGGWL